MKGEGKWQPMLRVCVWSTTWKTKGSREIRPAARRARAASRSTPATGPSRIGRTHRFILLPQVTTVTCRGSLQREKKRDRVARQPKGAELRPSFERAQAKRAHLKVALLAERHACGPDGQRMRSPQLAQCSRDQIRLRMAALARG